MVRKVAVRYDNLFNISFLTRRAFTSLDGSTPAPRVAFHMHFYPPLLRSATVRKFMVGYEMLADPQRDITPELSARG